MLQDIRDNSQGWIAKTIIGVVVLLLALTGFDAIIRGTQREEAAARVNGDDISLRELQETVNMQRRQLMMSMGAEASMLDEKIFRDPALKALIERKLLLQAAQSNRFAVSQQGLDQQIINTPEFQQDGKFSANLFDQRIQQMGYSRLQFRQLFQDEMLIGQLRAGIAGSGFVTENELQVFSRLENQTRDFASLTIKADPAKSKVEDDQIKAYYDSHLGEFMSPEQVVIEYLELKKSAFMSRVEVSQEALNELYQKRIANLSEQRDAAHILIEVTNSQNDQQAKTKIDEIKARLDKGEDFSKLAKEFSKDTGSAANGGNLGYAGRGIYDAKFEEALYGLQKDQISAPVKTAYGWHLIKLLGVKAAEAPSFEALKPELEKELKTGQVEQLFVDASKQLESSAYESADLAQPAQELGLKVKTSAPFGREGGEGVAANRNIIQTAFSPEVLEEGANSTLIDLDPETVLVLRVKEHRKSAQESLEQVAAVIRARLQQEHAAADAKSRGEALLAELRDGKIGLNQAYQGEEWKEVKGATRNQEGTDPLVIQGVFRMPRPASPEKPSLSGVALGNGDYLLIRLGQVKEDVKQEEAQQQNLRRSLASRAGQSDFAAFMRYVNGHANIEKYEAN